MIRVLGRTDGGRDGRGQGPVRREHRGGTCLGRGTQTPQLVCELVVSRTPPAVALGTRPSGGCRGPGQAFPIGPGAGSLRDRAPHLPSQHTGEQSREGTGAPVAQSGVIACPGCQHLPCAACSPGCPDTLLVRDEVTSPPVDCRPLCTVVTRIRGPAFSWYSFSGGL